jgi:hypothetical protein
VYQYKTVLAFICLISLQLCAASSFAGDILFIDLNNAPKEIAAVASAVRLVGKQNQIRVVPTLESIPVHRRQQIEKVNFELNKITQITERLIMADKLTKELDDKYMDQVAELGKTERVLTEGYDLNKMSNELSKLNAENFDMVIISGHHEHGYLGGELLNFEAKNLFDSAEAGFLRFNKTKYVFILGCNTGQDGVIQNWSKIFPSAKIIVAANNKAPIKTDQNNLAYIHNLVATTLKSSASDVIKDKGTANQYLRAIKKFNWPAALLWKPTPESAVYLK